MHPRRIEPTVSAKAVSSTHTPSRATDSVARRARATGVTACCARSSGRARALRNRSIQKVQALPTNHPTDQPTNQPASQPAEQKERVNCQRQDCKFYAHTTQGHGFCCKGCRLNGSHGTLCQQQRQVELKQPLPVLQNLPSSYAPSLFSGHRVEWQPSLLFGARAMGTDEKKMTGTETMHIEAYGGQLFASFGMWMSPAFVKKQFDRIQPCIARLDRAGGKWVVDMQGQHSSRFATRISCLKTITWTRDYKGQVLNPPVQQLVAMYGLAARGNFMLFRDDKNKSAPGAQHAWHEVRYSVPKDFRGESVARACTVYRDSVTGVERLFALHDYSGVMSGCYDPSSKNPGHVVWDKASEKLDLSLVGNPRALQIRPLALVVSGGRLYLSSGAWILRRVDGQKPVWKVVLDVTKMRSKDGELKDAVGGLRGMTAVPSLSGTGSSLLFCWTPNGQSVGYILRCGLHPGRRPAGRHCGRVLYPIPGERVHETD